MTNTKIITIKQRGRDGSTILRRALQQVKKDGTPMANRPARPMAAHIVIYPNGDYRYYNKQGVLARSRIAAERSESEYRRDFAAAKRASLAQLAR